MKETFVVIGLAIVAILLILHLIGNGDKGLEVERLKKGMSAVIDLTGVEFAWQSLDRFINSQNDKWRTNGQTSASIEDLGRLIPVCRQVDELSQRLANPPVGSCEEKLRSLLENMKVQV